MMNKKTTTVALATLAMALTTSCSTSKKAQEQVQQGTTSIEASKGNVENMDPEYLVLSDAQQAFAKKNNQFALNFFSQVAGFDSKVISPLSYLPDGDACQWCRRTNSTGDTEGFGM